MRYSYEYKRMCVEMYRQGKWVETPEGIKEKNFRDAIQIWARIEESCGSEALRHKEQNKVWTAEEKYKLVAKVLAGESNRATAIAAGINKGPCPMGQMLYNERVSRIGHATKRKATQGA